jgi:hypothetical protein
MRQRIGRWATLGSLGVAAVAIVAACSGHTTGATNVTGTSATLNAKGTCDGGRSCTAHIEYEKVGASAWTSTASRSYGAGTITDSVNVTGLRPSTSYQYRLAATQSNVSGMYYYDSAGTPNGTNYSRVTTADPSGAHWALPKALTWYWQLTGTVNTSHNANAYDIDGFDNTASTVASLHAGGHHAICYIDVGTWENWRSDASSFPSGLRGNNNGWPGERWLDVRPSGPYYATLKAIMTARFQMCKQKGFDAVEPDNMDSYDGNDPGFPTTASDQLTYDEWVADEVHNIGMAVFQKNDPNQASQMVGHFDGAIDEQCNEYSECSSFQPYVNAGKPVLNAEYQASLYPGFCAGDAKLGMMGALYDVDLDGGTYKPCWSGGT